ncbi:MULTISPECIES: SPOR domain-containing protein [Alistipes]|uniref:SPOR domain-containing protein n=1 Tax=Alistipes hominis TaxID=2763015 RepID=A0ABR7CL53_9BACT|nr:MULTISPECIES: SPOR domain-containing protein [Alistipes]MBC5616105.1 hypothetical protein [Alistipes hominis]MBS1415012.1 hypothetical protein [Alistipes sp.]RHR67506.1 hypothetical protein DWW79_00715 [Alistipes sp. AF17-16]
MDQVSNLVYNALAKRQGVVLPGIGTLYAVTVPAEMQKPGVVTPPVNRVELVTDELPGIPHIVDLIAGYDQTDPEQAREIYNRWLAENCSEEGVTIGAVGNIREGVFTPDPGLEEALNPVDTGAVRLPGRIDAKRVAMWVVFAVLIGVGISVGAIVWYEYSEQMRIVRLSEQPVLPASVPAAPDSPAVKVPAAAGSDSSAGESGASAGVDSSAAVPAKQPEPVREPATVPAAKLVPATAAMHYYVIVGTYSTDQNAEKFIASAQKKNDKLEYAKIPMPNGKILVSVFGATAETEANRMKNEVSGLFPDAWVFKSKSAR